MWVYFAHMHAARQFSEGTLHSSQETDCCNGVKLYYIKFVYTLDVLHCLITFQRASLKSMLEQEQTQKTEASFMTNISRQQL